MQDHLMAFKIEDHFMKWLAETLGTSAIYSS
uniref:Uncharacterized protein n=1 Tax=Arundo donax TaxID=35708 RepID=A0A0A9B0C0_ARUDO